MENVTVETIKFKEIKKLFLTKDGLPRRECLHTVRGLHQELDVPLSDNPILRSYQMHYGCSAVGALRRFFRNHNCLFIDPKIDGEVYHGFSQDEDKQINSFNRFNKFRRAMIASTNKHKQLMAGQLEFESLMRA